MRFFSKLKDYNNILEEILDRKTFSSVAKSLLLSMIYKLEISYKDYSQVNVDCVSKDAFLSNVVEVIKKYCDNIKIVEPESTQANLLAEHNVMAVTNYKERSILAYPTESAMIYSVADIEPKYFFLKKDFVFRNVFQKLLVEGYKKNTVRILKNFNGWSWDINPNEDANYEYELIYHNIMMIKGEQFLYDWRTDCKATKDYLKSLKHTLKSVTGNDNYYSSLCKFLYLNANKNDRTKIRKEINQNEKYYEILNNTKTMQEEFAQLQKYFLKFIEKKVEKISVQEQMLEVIYQLRYYQNLVYGKGIFVKDCVGLKKSLEHCMKIAITKACKMGIVKIVSMDIDTNFEILQYVLDTKIIDLEDIRIYIEIAKENILVKVYDKDIFEKQKTIEFHGNKKDIVIRKKKIIKLFT